VCRPGPGGRGRPRDLPPGPIESYTDRVAAGSLAAAGGVLAATRDPGRAAEALNASVPKAANMGREGFAAVLSGMAADDLRGPGSWGNGDYRLARAPGRDDDRADGSDGLRLLVTGSDDDRLGEVTVGCEVDPLAEAVLAAGRREGSRLHLTRHASLAGMIGRADEVVTGGLAEHVRRLQADGQAVLLVAAGDNKALGAADVAVGYLRDCAERTVGWAGDVICGPGLGEVWRLLRATGRARAVSERAVALAAGGATLGLLEAAVSQRGGAVTALSPVPMPRLSVSPVQVMSLTSLALGAYSARALAREDLPALVHHTAWHAMPANDALSRLDAERGTRTPPVGPPGPREQGGRWREWLDRLASAQRTPAAAAVRGAQLLRPGADRGRCRPDQRRATRGPGAVAQRGRRGVDPGRRERRGAHVHGARYRPGGRSPLNTRQVLLVNMLIDMFPALAVAGTQPKDDSDGDVPVSSAPLLTGPLGRGIAIRGGATAMGATLAWAGGRLTGAARSGPRPWA
jgi:hypothetical protein